MSPAHVPEDATRGHLIPIGGAEDKVYDSTILRRFLKLAGRDRARIAILPTASEARDTGRGYEVLFQKLGAREATMLPKFCSVHRLGVMLWAHISPLLICRMR